MKYFKVNASNGLCGCDEEWITTTEKDDLNFWLDVLERYTYEGGYAGIEDDDDMWAEYDADEDPEEGYQNAILDNTTWEEITEEEFIYLRDKEGLEER